MKCREVREAFSDLYDGTIVGDPLSDLQAHLQECPDCRGEWETFRRAVGALTTLRDEAPPPGFTARVMTRIEMPPWWRRALHALLLPLRVKLPVHAAALVALGVMGLWLFQQAPEVRRAADLAPAPTAERPSSPLPSPPPPVAPIPAPRTEVPQPTSPSKTSTRRAAPAPPASIESPAPQSATEAAKRLSPSRAEAEEEGRPVGSGSPHGTAPEADRPQSVVPASPGAPVPGAARSRLESARAPAADSTAAAKEQPAIAPTPPDPDVLVSGAKTALAAGRTEHAIEQMRLFLARFPADARAPEVRLLLAEAYRAARRYGEAVGEVETFLRRHPDDRNVPTAWFRRAEIRLESGDPAGCALLREALARYPDAPDAVRARGTLSDRCP